MAAHDTVEVLCVPGPSRITLVYLILGRDGHTLIDTGWNWAAAYESLTSQLAALGANIRDVRQVLLTHMHRDHEGLVDHIRRVSGARVFSPAWDGSQANVAEVGEHNRLAFCGVPEQLYEKTRSGRHSFWERSSFPKPDEWLVGGETIGAGNTKLEVISTPGHAIGHVCYYDRKNRCLFSGDHVTPVIIPKICSLLWDSSTGRDPLGDYLSSNERIKPLEVEIVFPAHDHVFSDLRGRLEEIGAHHEQMLQETRAATRNGWETAFQIARQITWSGREFDIVGDFGKIVSIGETMSYLEFLRNRGELARRLERGVAYYGGRKI